MKYLLAIILFAAIVWGCHTASAAFVPKAVEAPAVVSVTEPTSGTVVLLEAPLEASGAVEDTAEKAATTLDSILAILKSTEAIIALLIALVVAITSAIAKWKGEVNAKAAVAIVTEEIEASKATESRKGAATAIGEAVNKAAPREKSAAGALIHNYVKKAEKKLGK